MNVQSILTAAFYAVIISFMLVVYCEMAKSSLKVLQVSTDLRKARRTEDSVRQTLHQEQIDLNTLLEEHPTTSEEISHESIILPPVTEETFVEIAEPKMLTLIKK